MALHFEIEGKLTLDVPAEEIVELPGFYRATQTLFGQEKEVLTRVYDIRAGREYYEFLRAFNGSYILKPDYILEKDEKAVLVFFQELSTSLRLYFEGEVPDIFCTGTNLDDSLNRDFRDPFISVFWQFAAAINKSHDHNLFLGGKFSLDDIFVNVDEGVGNPRIYILPTFYERRARKGESFLWEILNNDRRSDDFYGFGKAMYVVCSLLSIKRNEAYEIYDLIHNLLNKKYKSMQEFLWHPALILSGTKMELVRASHEGIFKFDKIRYFGHMKVFEDPPHFETDPWTIKFKNILDRLDVKYRDSYTKSPEPNNLYNIRLFSKNIIEHLDSHPSLQNQFAGGASFLRFLTRTYYPKFFFDLITCINMYDGPVATMLKLQLNGNRQ